MRFNLSLGFYATGEWKYEQPNVDKLLEEMNDEDKKLFPFDMTNFNWHKYHLTTVRAIYRYIVKAYEDVEDPTEARRQYLRLVQELLSTCCEIIPHLDDFIIYSLSLIFRIYRIMNYILLGIKLYLLYLVVLTVRTMVKMYAYY